MAQKSWLGSIYQALGIAGIVIGTLSIPIKMRFNFVEARQIETIQVVKKHIGEDHKELEKKIPNKENIVIQYKTINEKLDALTTEMKTCRNDTKELYKKIYEVLDKD